MPKDWIRLATAEAIGTFALVFIGLLAITIGLPSGGLVGAALAYGLAATVMIATLAVMTIGVRITVAMTANSRVRY